MAELYELYYKGREDTRILGVLMPDDSGRVFHPVKTVFCQDNQQSWKKFRVDDDMDNTYVLNNLSSLGYTGGSYNLSVKSSIYALMHIDEMVDVTGNTVEDEGAANNWRVIELPWAIMRSLVGYIQTNLENGFEYGSNRLDDLNPWMAGREVEVVKWHDFPFTNGRYEVALNPTPNVVDLADYQVPPPPGTVQDFINQMEPVSSVLGGGGAAPAATPAPQTNAARPRGRRGR